MPADNNKPPVDEQAEWARKVYRAWADSARASSMTASSFISERKGIPKPKRTRKRHRRVECVRGAEEISRWPTENATRTRRRGHCRCPAPFLGQNVSLQYWMPLPDPEHPPEPEGGPGGP
jgi:hypothetical protein